MISNTDLQNRTRYFVRILCTAVILAIGFAACRNDVIDTEPADLPGTTWKFDDFYITFVSDSALNVHGEDPQDILAEGTYSIIEGFIEIALNGRVRAGSWDGQRLMVDGMVGRLIAAAAL